MPSQIICVSLVLPSLDAAGTFIRVLLRSWPECETRSERDGMCVDWRRPKMCMGSQKRSQPACNVAFCSRMMRTRQKRSPMSRSLLTKDSDGVANGARWRNGRDPMIETRNLDMLRQTFALLLFHGPASSVSRSIDATSGSGEGVCGFVFPAHEQMGQSFMT